jgi:hypothetical protein
MKKITVAIIGNTHHDLMRLSLEQTLAVTPDVESVLVCSDRQIYPTDNYVEIADDFSKHDYNLFCIKLLLAHVYTEFVLVCQYDGMAVNKNHWTDEFYNYDYIGAAWSPKFGLDEQYRVGNGGFSLRSRRLLEALQDPAISFETAEDVIICQRYADYLRSKHQIKYAPIWLADQFSQEWNTDHGQTFGFHGLLNIPMYLDDDSVSQYVQALKINQWYNDQLEVFVQRCHQRNYMRSLLALQEKLEQS